MTFNIEIFDSVTQLPADASELVAYCASHGGIYAGACAIATGVRALVLSDAGVGLHQAGIAALPLLDDAGVPAATTSHRSARIGDGRDGLERGRISHMNQLAAAQGLRIGDACADALALLAAIGPMPQKSHPPASTEENRCKLALPGARHVVIVDSNSLITAGDAGHVVICGSHGGILGGDANSAVRHDVHAIVFNDADGGIDLAGHSRLPALDKRRIPAACVSAWTACIGNGQSSYDTGVISVLNATAYARGARLGMSARAFADLFASQ